MMSVWPEIGLAILALIGLWLTLTNTEQPKPRRPISDFKEYEVSNEELDREMRGRL